MKIALLTTGRHDVACLTAIAKHLPDHVWIHGNMRASASDQGAALESLRVAWHCLDLIVDKKPDAVLVVGDRTETLTLCSLVVCLKIPIIHVSGGETTTGAIDDVCRNAISQLAGTHFVAHEQAASKLRYMGISKNIHVVGEPALDLILARKRERKPGVDIVLIYHPETLSKVPPLEQIQTVIQGVSDAIPDGGKVIMCGANPDAGGSVINDYLKSLDDRFVFKPDMGPEEFWDLLSTCACLVGNSSSGICEAPSLGVPVVNIGERQGGRMRAGISATVGLNALSIAIAINEMIAVGDAGPNTVYGDGHACERIAKVLVSITPLT